MLKLDYDKFEKEMSEVDFLKIEVTEFRLGYAVGWLWREISKRILGEREGSIWHHVNSPEALSCFLVRKWKQANAKILDSNQTLKSLLGYVINGLCKMKEKGKEVTDEFQGGIILGMCVR